MNIIDIHIYQGQWHWPLGNDTVRDTLAVMDRFGISKGVAMSADSIAYDFAQGNDELAEQLGDSGRLFGYVTVNGHYVQESVEQLRRHFSDPRFVGVKVHPSYSRVAIDSVSYAPIVEVMEEYGRPLLLHTSSTALATPYNAVAVAKRHPRLPIILSHMGRNAWGDAIDAAGQADNLYLDPCCSFPDAPKIEEAVRRLGAEKLLYGSAMMENHPGYTTGMIEDAGLNERQKHLIYHENAERLFALPEVPTDPSFTYSKVSCR